MVFNDGMIDIPDILQTGCGGYVGAIFVGLPLYICATSSTPLAAVLLSAGFSPGAIMVFLLVGPAFMLIAINKKQSPDEIASDERDKMIKAKAVMASYISAWIMLAVVIAIMMLASNEECMVEAILLVPLSVLMFIISVAVYSISTLIQYGKGGGGYE